MNIEAIKSIITLPAWLEIESLLREEFLNGKKPLALKTEGKTDQVIASEARGREYAAKAIEKFLRRLNTMKVINSKTGKKSYV